MNNFEKINIFMAQQVDQLHKDSDYFPSNLLLFISATVARIWEY